MSVDSAALDSPNEIQFQFGGTQEVGATIGSDCGIESDNFPTAPNRYSLLILSRNQMPLRSLLTRRREPELMDQPGLDAAQHQHALGGLARINWWSRSDAIFWPSLEQLSHTKQQRTGDGAIKVLDLACGGGDVTVALAQRAARTQRPMTFTGVDLSETALEVARERSREAAVSVEFQQRDVSNADLPTGFDAVICSLFLHHLDEPDAVTLLRKMSQSAERLVLVNDLIRSTIGYGLAVCVTRLLTRSHIVHVDGPLSVAGAFSIDEARRMASEAGMGHVTIQKHWPWRFLLSWSRS